MILGQLPIIHQSRLYDICPKRVPGFTLDQPCAERRIGQSIQC